MVWMSPPFPAVPDLVGFRVPGLLVLAPARDRRPPVLHTERVELPQEIGVVVNTAPAPAGCSA